MSYKAAVVTVGDTPTSLIAGVTDTKGGPGRRTVLVQNPATNSVSVEIVGPDDEYGDGYVLGPGDWVSLPVDEQAGDVPYAITGSGTAAVRVLHVGV